ncbi:MAG: hypothetical protein R3F30_04560 [Planctomycetota bacterium]
MANEDNAWLLSAPTDAQRFARVAAQMRGFDLAMLEVGHRYINLYWAGEDHNWELAGHEVEKIRLAIDDAVERRPARATSARMIDGALAGMVEAIDAQDPMKFEKQFTNLTATCNTCHKVEKMPYVVVYPPEVRVSPTGPLPEEGAGR